MPYPKSCNTRWSKSRMGEGIAFRHMSVFISTNSISVNPMKMFFRGFIILMLTAVCPATAPAASVEEARAAISRKDYPLAMRLWRELADQGDPLALFAVGMLYQDGQGVAKDEAEAVRWFLRAAQKGNEGAQEVLYEAYMQGRGVPVDYAEAEKWMRPLAEKGYGMSQFFLAGLYLRKQNLIESYKWLMLAKRQTLTSDLASKGLENLRAKMSRSDVAEAERLASEWRPQPKQR